MNKIGEQVSDTQAINRQKYLYPVSRFSINIILHLFNYSPIHLTLFWITEMEIIFYFYLNYVEIEPAFEYITLIEHITRSMCEALFPD